MARSGALNKTLSLSVNFYKDGVLTNPDSITSVKIYDVSSGGTAIATVTPTETSTGVWTFSWSPLDTDSTLTTGTYYDEWVWTSISGQSEKTQRYSFDLTAATDSVSAGSLVPDSNGGFYVDGVFDNNANRTLQGANVWFADASSGAAQEMDSITLKVTDGASIDQYLLTTTTTPAITLETPANVYVVDDIDVTAFNDGNISLLWTGEKDGYSYTITQVIEYNTAPSMVFVTAETQSVSDLDITIGSQKTFTVKLTDSLYNTPTANAVRLRIIDTANSSTVFNLSATNTSGTGLWSVTRTFSSGDLGTQLEKYQIYWQVQLTAEGSWLEIPNSRNWINVYGQYADVLAAPLTYCTNQDIRIQFPNIDDVLTHINPNQAEREIILNNKRKLISATVIEPGIRASSLRKDRDLLKYLEVYEVYRACLTTAHSFGRFSIADGQLKEIEKQIQRIKTAMFGTVSTVRIGPASPRY